MRSSYAVPRGTTLVAPTNAGPPHSDNGALPSSPTRRSGRMLRPDRRAGLRWQAATGRRVHGPNARRVSTLPRSLSRGTRYYSPSTHLSISFQRSTATHPGQPATATVNCSQLRGQMSLQTPWMPAFASMTGGCPRRVTPLHRSTQRFQRCPVAWSLSGRFHNQLALALTDQHSTCQYVAIHSLEQVISRGASRQVERCVQRIDFEAVLLNLLLGILIAD